MGTLIRSYGRRVRPLDPTPIAQNIIALFPLILAIVLAAMTAKILPRAKIKVLSAALQSKPPSTPLGPSPASVYEEAALFTLLTPEVSVWKDNIMHWSKDYALPPSLVAIVMQLESCGFPPS